MFIVFAWYFARVVLQFVVTAFNNSFRMERYKGNFRLIVGLCAFSLYFFLLLEIHYGDSEARGWNNGGCGGGYLRAYRVFLGSQCVS